MVRRIHGLRWILLLLVGLVAWQHDAVPAQGPAAAPVDALGDPLPARALQRFGTSRFRHGSRVQCLAFTLDGNRLAGGGGNDPVRIWDANTGRQLQQLAEPWINALAFSRRGNELYTGGALKVVRIWDLEKNKEVAQLTGHTSAITAVAVSTDNTLLASGSEDGTVILWAKGATNITIAAQFKGHTDKVTSLAFAPDIDSVYLASGSADRTVRLWSVDQKKMLHQLDAGCSVTSVAFVDDATLASAGDDKLVRLWNAADGKPVQAMKGHQGTVLGLAAARDGKTLVSSGDDNMLRVWDAAARKELLAIPRSAGDGEALAVTKNGQLVACGGANHTIRLFDAKTGQERLATKGSLAGLVQLAQTSDGKSIATAAATGTVTIWNRQTAQPTNSWDSGHAGEIVLAYAPDGSLLVSGSKRDPLRFWNPQTGKEAFQFPGKPGDAVQALAFAPVGKLLAVGYNSVAVDVWDWQQKKIVQQPKLTAPIGVQSIAFSLDGAVLALGGMGKILLWDVAGAKVIRELDSKEDVNAASRPAVASLAFAADGKTLAVGCYDGAIRLIDRIKGKELRTLEGHASVPYALAFSPDGRVLVSGSFDRSLRIWETFSGLAIAALPGHQGPLHSVAMAADGRTVWSASSDTSVLAWDLTGRAQEGFDPKKATPIDFNSAWLELASEDAARGQRVLWDLVAQHPTSLPLISKQLFLVDPKRIDQMFKNLDSTEYNVRKRASDELEKSGRWMEGRFKEALKGTLTLETQRRIELMLSRLTGGLSLEQERIRVRRVMLILEQVNSPAARQVLQSIVEGAPEVDLQTEARSSLERLAKRQ